MGNLVQRCEAVYICPCWKPFNRRDGFIKLQKALMPFLILTRLAMQGGLYVTTRHIAFLLEPLSM